MNIESQIEQLDRADEESKKGNHLEALKILVEKRCSMCGEPKGKINTPGYCTC